MSSRSLGKNSKKEKLYDKEKHELHGHTKNLQLLHGRKNRKDDNIEKSSTPNEQLTDKKKIIDDSIRRLQIIQGNLPRLEKLADGLKKEKNVPILVQVKRNESPLANRKFTLIDVAKPAPDSTPVDKTCFTTGSGVRFTSGGGILRRSVLGDANAYLKVALSRGDLPEELKENDSVDSVCVEGNENIEQSNALLNWQHHLDERRKQQQYIAQKVKKREDELVMSTIDDYRRVVEQKELVERAQQASQGNLWKSKGNISNNGIAASLIFDKAPLSLEVVRIPDVVKREKGIYNRDARSSMDMSSYFQDRQTQLTPIIKEINNSFLPEFGELQVVGCPIIPKNTSVHSAAAGVESSDKCSEYFHQLESRNSCQTFNFENFEEDTSLPVVGASLEFAGHQVAWNQQVNASFIQTSVPLQAVEGRKASSSFQVFNTGTTAVYYHWKKLEIEKHFDIDSTTCQRFYFNTSDGVILPGDAAHFAFIFKSKDHGIYRERWQLVTHPTMACGIPLIVNLKGAAVKLDKFKYKRTQLESILEHRVAKSIALEILYRLVGSIANPQFKVERQGKLSSEQKFCLNNPHLFYDELAVKKLKEIQRELRTESVKDDENLQKSADDQVVCVTSLREEFLSSDFSTQDRLQKDFLDATTKLAVPAGDKVENSFTTTQAVSLVIGSALDRIDLSAQNLKQRLGEQRQLPIEPLKLAMEPAVAAKPRRKSKNSARPKRENSDSLMLSSSFEAAADEPSVNDEAYELHCLHIMTKEILENTVAMVVSVLEDS